MSDPKKVRSFTDVTLTHISVQSIPEGVSDAEARRYGVHRYAQRQKEGGGVSNQSDKLVKMVASLIDQGVCNFIPNDDSDYYLEGHFATEGVYHPERLSAGAKKIVALVESSVRERMTDPGMFDQVFIDYVTIAMDCLGIEKGADHVE